VVNVDEVNTRGLYTFYGGRRFLETWRKLKIIAEVKGVPMSRLIVSILEDYVQKHEPEIPQTLLTSFSEESENNRIVLRRKIVEELKAVYSKYGIKPRWIDIIERVRVLMPELNGNSRIREAKAIIQMLKQFKVEVEEAY